jgi:ribosomal protein L34
VICGSSIGGSSSPSQKCSSARSPRRTGIEARVRTQYGRAIVADGKEEDGRNACLCFRGCCAGALAPRAASLTQPLQHVQVPACSGTGACLLSPRAACRTSPHQHSPMPMSSSSGAGELIPSAAVNNPQHHQDLEVASRRSLTYPGYAPYVPRL